MHRESGWPKGTVTFIAVVSRVSFSNGGIESKESFSGLANPKMHASAATGVATSDSWCLGHAICFKTGLQLRGDERRNGLDGDTGGGSR
jgi:hypothetical protein